MKLKKFHKRLRKQLAPKTKDYVLPFGKFKNCRVGFIMDINPLYIAKLVEHKTLLLDKEALILLGNKIQEVEWKNFLLK